MAHRFGSPEPSSASEIARRKKRRYESRSDEEIRQEMDQRGLSYRAGWPQLPPLPVMTLTSGAQNSVENAVTHLQKASTIFQVQRINVESIFFAYRIPKDAEAHESNERYLTLVITTNMTISNTIGTAITQTRQNLKSHDETEDISIEVIDHRALHGLNTFPIHFTEKAIIDVWPIVLDSLISELDKRSDKWLCIELAHRGVLDEVHRCRPTVVITSPTASQIGWWTNTLPALRNRIRSMAPGFEFEVLCGVTLYGAHINWKYGSGQGITPQSYDTQVVMGASIGCPTIEGHAGTVGGLIKLADKREYGLTNYRVVIDDRVETIIDDDGMLRPHTEQLRKQPQHFNSPADGDHVGYLEKLGLEKHAWVQQREKGNPNAVGKIMNIDTQINDAKQKPRYFGHLHAGSGRRTVSTEEFGMDTTTGQAMTKDDGKGTTHSIPKKFLFPLDWALLSIDRFRSLRNELPKMLLPTRAKTGIIPEQLCNRWSTLNAGKTHIKRNEVEVAKFGRTTTWTFGTVAPIMLVINPEEDKDVEDIAKKYSFTGERPGYCYGIYKRGKDQFAEEGDSGSIVVHDPSGVWLGLLFAQSGLNTGFMMPMELVFRDIEQVTGLAVVEPTFEKDP